MIMNPTLSVVIPVYNEGRTLQALLDKVLIVTSALSAEVIVVNDGSQDNTGEILSRYAEKVCVLTHAVNRGKGAAVRTGFTEARGTYVVVQDGDLEYDPTDLVRMLQIAKANDLPVIYGSRRLPLPGEDTHRGAWQYYLGGLLVTWFTNIVYGTQLTDEPTCYKMIHRDVLARIPLVANGFEFCPEVTAKITRLGVPIYEIPIHYTPRSEKEGKKIRPKDGIIAILTLLRYRFWKPPHTPTPQE